MPLLVRILINTICTYTKCICRKW